MEEGLRTTRVIHNILIILTATIFAFAVSPDKTRDYRAALNELVKLRHVQQMDIAPEWYEVSRFFQNESDFGLEFGLRGLKKPLIELLEREGLSVDDGFRIIRPIYHRQLGSVARLEDVRRFLVHPEEDFLDLSSKHAQIEIDSAVKRLLAKPGVRRNLRGRECVAARIFLPDSFYRSVGDPHDRKESHTLYEDKPDASLSMIDYGRMELRFMDQNGPIAMELDGTFPLERCHVVFNPAVNPFGSQLEVEWRGLVPEQGRALPALSAFSNAVDGMTVDEARAFLQQKLDALHNEVTVFGITVDVSVAVWAGPGLTLAILLFLFSHLRNLRYALELESEFKGFPWIALFTDRLSRVLTYSSVVVLPVLSNSLLLRRSWFTWKEPRLILGIAAGIGVCVCALLVSDEIRRIQSIIADMTGIESNRSV
ncbi:MAG: hypothetical protein DMF61_23290 [Blastocatellia bacterium AA13]|nr:MAG: hypothetical protein DMF61_23290 [Blastocatellia bacterium AA13]